MAKSAGASRDCSYSRSLTNTCVQSTYQNALSVLKRQEKPSQLREWRQPGVQGWYDKEIKGKKERKKKKSAGTDGPTRKMDPQGLQTSLLGCVLTDRSTGSRRCVVGSWARCSARLGVHGILSSSRKASFSNVVTESVMGVCARKGHVHYILYRSRSLKHDCTAHFTRFRWDLSVRDVGLGALADAEIRYYPAFRIETHMGCF